MIGNNGPSQRPASSTAASTSTISETNINIPRDVNHSTIGIGMGNEKQSLEAGGGGGMVLSSNSIARSGSSSSEGFDPTTVRESELINLFGFFKFYVRCLAV